MKSAVVDTIRMCPLGKYTNASNVAILVSFGPIVTAVLARLLTKDRSLSVWLVAGSLVAVCGVALVALNGVVNFQMRPIGDLMALGAMVSWGFYSVLVDKANAKGIPPMTAIRKAFFWALVMMVPLAVWGGTKSGNQCTRRARPGERYCKQHAANVEVKKTPKRCCSINEKGVQCTRKPEPNRRYCKQHLGR